MSGEGSSPGRHATERPARQSFGKALRARGLWGLAVAYLAIGFGLVEATELVVPRLQLPARSVDLLLALLFFAFPVALLARWRLEGRGRSEVVSPGMPLAAFCLVAGLSGWLGVRAIVATDAAADPGAEALPLVILMDSPHPARVYDEATRIANATNADVLSDVLLDLPIRRQRESIGPEWHRDEEILQFAPDLVVIHYSGFRQEDGGGPRERLRLFISFFVEAETQFLVYSRADEADLRESMESLLADLEAEHPGLLDRVSVFGLDDYGPPSWLSPLTTNPLKLRVKELLGIP